MPGEQSHLGARRHVRIARNGADDAYGATIAAPDWHWVPLLGDGMQAKGTSPRYVPDTNYGGDFRRHVAVHHQQQIEGDLTTLLWPELTQYLFDAALLRVDDADSPNHEDLYGHVIEHHTPVDPRRHYGAVVDTLRLACSPSGDNDAQLTLGLIAQREVEITASNPDYSGLTPVPFMAGFARITIEGDVVSDVESWTLSVSNNVERGPLEWNGALGVAVIAHAIAQRREISVELTKLDNRRRFNRAIRRGDDLSFQASFFHPDGHLFQILLPACYVEEAAEDGTPSQNAKTNPTLHARVADAGPHAGHDIVYGADLGPTTTTLEPPTTTTTGA